MQGTFLNTIKAIYSRPIPNLKQNKKKLKAIILKSETREGFPFSLYLFPMVLEVVARAIKTTKGDHGDTNWKGRSQSITVLR